MANDYESGRYRMTDPERILKLEQEIRVLKERRLELQAAFDESQRRIRALEDFRTDLHARLQSLVRWIAIMASCLGAGVSLAEHWIFK